MPNHCGLLFILHSQNSMDSMNSIQETAGTLEFFQVSERRKKVKGWLDMVKRRLLWVALDSLRVAWEGVRGFH